MKIIGEIKTRTYRLTVMVDSPPAIHRDEESQWIYLTKHYPGEHVGRQSIGMGMSEIDGLMQLLNRASSEYRGRRKEFRVMSSELEQRTVNRE